MSGECPAGGFHSWEFLSAGEQEDDSGKRFYDRWACAECGASPPVGDGSLIPWRDYEGCPFLAGTGPCLCDQVDWSTP